MRLFVLCCIFTITLSSPAQPATIHVPADQPTIQAGINAAAQFGDTVLVAPGTYRGAGNRNLNTMAKAIVLTSELGPDSTIIDCEFQARGLCFKTGEGLSTVIDGFTVRSGNVSGLFPDGWGGGILCLGSSPSIRNCVIKGNNVIGPSAQGGGLALFDSSPGLENCVISENTALQGYGGGVYCHTESEPILSNCAIFGNMAYIGAGLATILDSFPSLSGCAISSNIAGDRGGGVFCDATSALSLPGCTVSNNSSSKGGGIYFDGTNDLTLSGVSLFENQAGNGGGAIEFGPGTAVTITESVCKGGGYVVYCFPTSMPTMVDCVISDGDLYGAVVNDASPTFRRCTFVGNVSTGVVFLGNQGFRYIDSCTFYQNGIGIEVASQGELLIERTIIVFSQSSALTCIGGVTASCCDLWGNLGGNWTGCLADQEGKNGNFSANPRFCDAANGDYSLNSVSPCAPVNSPPGCGLIGAFPVGCGVAEVAPEEAPSADLNLMVMPNPVRGTARFEYGSIAPLVKLTIFDSQGRLVEELLRQDGAWQWTPGPSIPAGVYFARPDAADAGSAAVKFLYLR
jgi:parallel beta-helix repeat protein/predicted outer membrane repeat protein